MDDFMRAAILIFMILYLVSPIDACPGPLDDAVIILIGMALRRQLAD
ncbi:MAG: hypothetical protein Q4E45_09695 [Eubacteriales bacterium]|nr:hypothetical protein [Eubacteriales bacterium]